MNIDCRTYALEMDDLLDGGVDAGRAAGLHAHADACAACGTRWQAAVALRQRLRELPAPNPAPGYATRVRAAVLGADRPALVPAVAAYALAASVTAAIAVSFLVGRSGQDVVSGKAPVAAAAPVLDLELNEVKSVRLVFRSPRSLSGVTVQLQLPDGVELDGYPGQHELRWSTDLAAGANSLDLPVIVRHGDGGLVTANLSHGDSRRQFSVPVKVRQSAVSPGQAVAQLAAASVDVPFVIKEVGHA